MNTASYILPTGAARRSNHAARHHPSKPNPAAKNQRLAPPAANSVSCINLEANSNNSPLSRK
ncbi:hypothetical protein A2U01_0072383 [Trifolium medium]|uniref:Uncharacterized protein n=1 Tax=Trifolium medium TaxID=97028 RepID=A0A392SR25_9FABA|nr:hypothetical protein [Trifolium medium]